MKHSAYLKTGFCAALALLQSIPAFANPQGGKVVEGAATIVQETPTKLTINQHTNKAIIDWKSFSIGNGEHTQFKQPSASSISLNRVTGNQVSKILGRLSANGKVFLINPNGVVFGPNSRVDVNGLLATTHDIKNKDFMAGRYNFNKSGKPNARIINQGRINVDDGGYVALIAPGVENTGYINAYLGRVDLASANGFTLSFGNNSLVSFLPDQKILASIKTADGTPLSALIENSGRIAANGGSVILSAHAVRKIADSTISNSGFIEAHSFGVKNGIISLFGDEGDVSITGTLDASGLQAGETGGEIQVTGKNVGLYSGAKVTASGDVGGGEILIGGDVRGQGSLPNAQGVYIAQTATISADAITQGNGGKVIAWSDNSSRVYGKLSARGGTQGGDGGFIETSSKNYLDVRGAPDVSAPKGKGGEWLLDPRNVTISTGTTSGATSGAGTFTPTANNSIINKTDIETALNAGTSVTVTTGATGAQAGTMTVTMTSSIAKSAGGDATLTLTSASDMMLSSSITSTVGKLNLDFRSTAGSIKFAASPAAAYTVVNSNNGNITLNAGTNVEFNKSRVTAGTGDVVVTAGVGVKVLQNNSINKARDVSITAGSYISNLGNLAAYADNNPDVKVDRNLTLTSPRTSLDFSGNGSGTLTYNFNGGSGALWGRTRELNNMFGTVVIDSRNFTGTSLDFYQTSSNGNKIGFEIASNTLRFDVSTLTTLEGRGIDVNQIGITNTNSPRQTTLYANNWTVDNTLINGPVHLSGYAANTWNTYSTYNSATKDTLFSAIKAGQLTPGLSNLGWRSLYQSGAATTAQSNAYTMWDSYDTFNGYSQQRLFEAIRDNEKTKVLNATLTPGTSELTWTALYVNGNATTTQTNAYTMWQSYLQYRYASATTLFNAIKSGTLTPNTSDIKWTALYVNGTARATQAQAYQMWLNYLHPPTTNVGGGTGDGGNTSSSSGNSSTAGASSSGRTSGQSSNGGGSTSSSGGNTGGAGSGSGEDGGGSGSYEVSKSGNQPKDKLKKERAQKIRPKKTIGEDKEKLKKQKLLGPRVSESKPSILPGSFNTTDDAAEEITRLYFEKLNDRGPIIAPIEYENSLFNVLKKLENDANFIYLSQEVQDEIVLKTNFLIAVRYAGGGERNVTINSVDTLFIEYGVAILSTLEFAIPDVSLREAVASSILDFIPGISELKGAYEGARGVDAISRKQLTTSERWGSALSTGIGVVGAVAGGVAGSVLAPGAGTAAGATTAYTAAKEAFIISKYGKKVFNLAKKYLGIGKRALKKAKTNSGVNPKQVNAVKSPLSEIRMINGVRLRDGMRTSEDKALDMAEQFLGKNQSLRKAQNTRGNSLYTSKDGKRRVRLNTAATDGNHGAKDHFNFDVEVPDPKKPGRMKWSTMHIYTK